MNKTELESLAADLGLPEALAVALAKLVGGERPAAPPVLDPVAEVVIALLREQRKREANVESAVASLVDGLVKIAAGDFGHRIDRELDGGPMDVLAYLVNNMVEELAIRVEQEKARADEDRQRLQLLVDQRTADLRSTNVELSRKNDQLVSTMETLERTHAHLVQSEKMAAVGQLVASVAHELNTPLGAIRASVDNLVVTTDTSIGSVIDAVAEAPPLLRAEWLDLVRRAGANAAPLTSREERAARRRVIEELEAAGVVDSEELASLLTEVGLVGGAGELTQVQGLLRSAQRDELFRAAHAITGLRRNAQNIRTAAERASKIVFALRKHAHPGEVDGTRTQASLSENLDSVLVLYQSQIKRSVDVVRAYEDPGMVHGHHDELNQVWANLVHNALQAMKSQGRLEVSVRRDAAGVLVAITDSGPGIPADYQGRIFEPFFTTKGPGEGSGLGLSISRDIVVRHGGRISVESQPGRTCFSVRLPGQPAQADEGEART